MTPCPDDNTFSAYLERALGPGAEAEVERHVDDCERCGAAMANAARAGATGAVDAVAAPAALVPPPQIGRYAVQARIEAGAMGVVYLAYDPELERKIALKVLHPHAAGTDAEAGNARLVREAQAMASVSHPNVIAVHDVGTVDGQVFIAMELADATVRTWLRAAPRTWQEICRVYLGAARGLTAAHEAGLVHRDFKPENVLVDGDSRVRVADFGLARPTVAPAAPASRDDAQPGRGLTRTLTQTGALVGTPAYMAPEQLRGEAADHRSDQFSFCVALHEALYGARPFAGVDASALLAAIEAQRIAPAPGGARVPPWLRQLLRRGLRAQPAERHPDMAAVVDALAVDRARQRRRTWAIAAVAAVLVSSMAATWIAARRQGDDGPTSSCARARRGFDATWNPQRKQALTTALLASGRAHAPSTATRVGELLDAYATAWRDGNARRCEADASTPVPSPAVDALRAHCLQQRQQGLDALVTTLADETTDEIVDQAVTAASALAPIEACDDTAMLARLAALPEDPATRADIGRADGELARARSLLDLGAYDRGLAMIEALVPEVTRLDHAPLTATAEATRGYLLEGLGRFAEAETALRAALDAASTAGDDAVIAALWSSLSMLKGDRLGDRVAGLELIKVAELALARAHQPPVARATFLLNYAALLRAAGKPDEAIPRAREAIALLERRGDEASPMLLGARIGLSESLRKAGKAAEAVEMARAAVAAAEPILGPFHPRVLIAQMGLADSLRSAGRIDDALALYAAALPAQRRQLGATHPLVARGLTNQGLTLAEAGQFEAAAAALTEALHLIEQDPAGQQKALATVLSNLGTVHYRAGKHLEALAELERARDLGVAAFGADHANISELENSIGAVLIALGRDDDGERHLREALRIVEAALGPDHPKVAQTLNNLGDLAQRRANFAAAEGFFTRALAIRRATQGDDHVELAPPTYNLGEVARNRGRCAAAEPYYRRALALWTAGVGAEHVHVAFPYLGLGRCAMQRHRTAEAIDDFTRALALRSGPIRDPALEAEARFELAGALWAAHRRPRALEEARAALALYRGADASSDNADEVARWLEAKSQ